MTQSAKEAIDSAAFDLETTFVQLEDGGDGSALVPDEDFWPSLASGERKLSGRLVMASSLQDDMAHWEMHPLGEELLILLSGAVEVILDDGSVENRVGMSAGEAFLVPRGVWHRIVVRRPAKMVFATYGEGTEHRPLAPAD